MAKKNSYLKRRRKQNQRFLLTIFAVLLVAGLSYYAYGVKVNRETASLDKEIHSSVKKKESLQAEIKELKDDYEKRNTDEFKEKIARDRLDMVKKSEVVYEDDNNWWYKKNYCR